MSTSLTPAAWVQLLWPAVAGFDRVAAWITIAEATLSHVSFAGRRDRAVALYALHNYQLEQRAFGLNGETQATGEGPIGAVTSESEGGLSRSVTTPAMDVEGFRATRWGILLLQLMPRTNMFATY